MTDPEKSSSSKARSYVDLFPFFHFSFFFIFHFIFWARPMPSSEMRVSRPVPDGTRHLVRGRTRFRVLPDSASQTLDGRSSPTVPLHHVYE